MLHRQNSVAIREILDIVSTFKRSMGKDMRTGEFSRVSGQHFVNEGTLVDFYRFIVSTIPLHRKPFSLSVNILVRFRLTRLSLLTDILFTMDLSKYLPTPGQKGKR